MKNKNITHIEHPLKPIFDKNSLILILGSFPSVKSRENSFYYGNLNNRFWSLIAFLTNTFPVPKSIEEKIAMLKINRIALWDVIKSCDITGSSDNSIKNVETSDLSIILEKTEIKAIYANGGKAYNLYMKYCYSKFGKNAVKLPSTSPANALYSFEELAYKWSSIKEYICN